MEITAPHRSIPVTAERGRGFQTYSTEYNQAALSALKQECLICVDRKTTHLGLKPELEHKWRSQCRGSVADREKWCSISLFCPQRSKPCHYGLTGFLLTVWTMKSTVPSRRVALLKRSSRYLVETWHRQKRTYNTKGQYQKGDIEIQEDIVSYYQKLASVLALHKRYHLFHLPLLGIQGLLNSIMCYRIQKMEMGMGVLCNKSTVQSNLQQQSFQ